MSGSSTSKVIACFSSSMSWGGLEMNIVRWAKWLSDDGKTVKVFCQKDSPIEEEARHLSLEVVYIKQHRKYFDFSASYHISQLLRKHHCSKVLFRDNFDMSTLVLAKRFIGKKKLKLCYFQGMRLGVSKRDYVHTLRFKKLDAWITPLAFLKQEVLENTKYTEKRIHVLPLALDENFKATRSIGEVREELGFLADDFVFGVMGRLDPGKGQDTFVKALTFLSDSKVKGLIMGDETKNSSVNFKAQLEKLITANGWTDRIKILPAHKDVANYMNACDSIVMSSKAETFGMVTIEALSLGKIVIGTNSGGTPEILGNGKYGALVSPENEKELHQAMDEVFTQHENYRALTERAKKNALEKYSKASFIKGLNRILADL